MNAINALKMLNAETQSYQVLQYIVEHGSITPAEAFTELGVYRLSGRIHDLRSIGVDIATNTETKKTGKVRKSYARYTLNEDAV